jgi:hypothetical protein
MVKILKRFKPEMRISTPRIVDFIPLLGLQHHLAPLEKMYHYVGTLSVPLDTLTNKSSLKTELGGQLHTVVNSRASTRVEYGHERPGHVDDVFSKKEVFDELMNISGWETDDIIGKTRGVSLPIPRKLEETFDGCERIYLTQQAYSNQIITKRRMLNAKFLENPYRIAQQVLIDRGIDHGYLRRRLRSTYKTNWIHSDGKNCLAFDIDEVYGIQQQICHSHQDIALPKHLFTTNRDKDIVMYQLARMTGDVWIAI